MNSAERTTAVFKLPCERMPIAQSTDFAAQEFFVLTACSIVLCAWHTSENSGSGRKSVFSRSPHVPTLGFISVDPLGSLLRSSKSGLISMSSTFLYMGWSYYGPIPGWPLILSEFPYISAHPASPTLSRDPRDVVRCLFTGYCSVSAKFGSGTP